MNIAGISLIALVLILIALINYQVAIGIVIVLLSITAIYPYLAVEA